MQIFCRSGATILSNAKRSRLPWINFGLINFILRFPVATILRDWSYQYPWLYQSVSWLSALAVGGDRRFRRLFLQDLNLTADMQVLDLCCGTGLATEILAQYSHQVTGLDASPRSLDVARQKLPQANFVQGWAEQMPFVNHSFDLVLTSTALHEMRPEQLQRILVEVYRVLKPGGKFSLVDFHAPTNPLFWLPLSVFLYLFETETAWQLLQTDLPQSLQQVGFKVEHINLHAGGSLQVVRAAKPN
ncbi:MAG: methyltransferase domain-containing protein [Pseudanabaenaceae cyanobacterium bins.68]|nr:methyltransferase domain-containing protein [Pseudanabaenaceae cyanobacterium bins.68]